MSDLRIVVDIDGVLANVDTYICVLNQETGKKWTREDMTWYNALWGLYGQEAANEVFADENVITGMEPRFENINEVYMWGLSNNCAIDIVTSRPAEVKEATAKWLISVGLGNLPVHHTPDKVAWVKEQTDGGFQVNVWIDDCAEVCEGVSPYVGATFLVDRPWNWGHNTWIPVITDLRDVTEYLAEVPLPLFQPVLHASNASIQEPQLAGDVGYDMCCKGVQVIPSKCFRQVPIGIKDSALRVAIPEGYWGFIMGRSGTLREGLIVSSTPIDSGYRGPLYVFVYNTGDQNMSLGENERIAQLVLIKSFTPPLQIVGMGILPPSERGEQGFGSTGK